MVLHAKGWLPCHLLQRLQPGSAGLPVTVGTCKIESIICAVSTYGHGFTWRSTVLNGTAHMLVFDKPGMQDLDHITDEDVCGNEKLYGLRKIVNGIVPGQWEYTRRVIKREVDQVLMLRVDIDPEKSHVHVRHGIANFAPDYESADRKKIWEGSIPIWEAYGDPFYGNTEAEFPPRLKRFFEDQTRKNKAYAIVQAGAEFKPVPLPYSHPKKRS
ncbi:hypothetical protein EYZ11_002374 [Aspergillus tanneri]|uniref:Uncharacterized protein n=1 Tax=Aspergillus tanneri TaxID=1220188 RepID=A0A4S3JRQ5_9EURO|nr:uncharacterized protein ATNIH1004_001479 [Aspergillus tanneri]KAA8652574.1 hypothetical protein ATNIH1004_001479 [Aspergillus tanneri]THC98150.1 hypothetical protein EYZ11_002374 [Aspergillus tanneri]